MKKALAAHRKKFGRVRGGVRIDGGGLVAIQLRLHSIECRLQRIGPLARIHARRQRRRPVGLPPSMSSLVGQLVDHQIEAVPIPVLLQLAPGQHQRPLRPGFAGVLLFNFAHQPELVLPAAGAPPARGSG